MNAAVLKDHEAAEMIIERDLSGEVLANKILFLMQNRANLFKMEYESRKMGKPNAAKEIVEYCYKLIKKGVKGSSDFTRTHESSNPLILFLLCSEKQDTYILSA